MEEKKTVTKNNSRKQSTAVSKPKNTKVATPQNDESRAMVSQLLSEVSVAARMPKVRNDEELALRFEQYFDYCSTNGIVPTIEEMYLYTGYSIGSVTNWLEGKHGFSQHTASIVRRARDFVQASDAKLAISGKMDKVLYIFRGKNFYSMTDSVKIDLTQASQTEGKSIQELQEIYAKSVPIDVDE